MLPLSWAAVSISPFIGVYSLSYLQGEKRAFQHLTHVIIKIQCYKIFFFYFLKECIRGGEGVNSVFTW